MGKSCRTTVADGGGRRSSCQYFELRDSDNEELAFEEAPISFGNVSEGKGPGVANAEVLGGLGVVKAEDVWLEEAPVAKRDMSVNCCVGGAFGDLSLSAQDNKIREFDTVGGGQVDVAAARRHFVYESTG